MSVELLAELAEALQLTIEEGSGIIIPDLNRFNKLELKISASFDETTKRISQLKLKKPIVYLPGSYDLVHIGHASYVDQVITVSGLAANDLGIVLLADDDSLIRKAKAAKYGMNGGSEPVPRPVEAASESLGHLFID